MAAPREDHGQPALVRGGNHLGVLDRAARLHDGRRAGLRDGIEPVPEGKNASDATTLPFSDPGAAFITATFTESTRLICPAPTASVRSAPVKTIVFDFTCAHTRHANRSAVHSSAVGCRLVTTR